MTETPQENQIVQARTGTLTLDVALYEHYLENWKASDQEKQALLQTLWDLICEFVFLGFGVSPVQQVMPDVCGQAGAGLARNYVMCLDRDQVESSCKTFNEPGGEHA